jgi:hypothetical protein
MAGCGMAVGVALTLAILRAFASVRRHGKDRALLSLPLGVNLEVGWENSPDGLNLHEALEVLEKIQSFNRLLDFSVVLEYTRKYGISYLGLKGSNPSHSWNPGCLACSSLDWSPPGGYRIYLNPDLPLDSIAARLSRELGLELKPEEVQLFLFLHEIGHTRLAGNVCFISAAISSALSGGRRTHRRRKELQKLKVQVEKFADSFAVAELLKWRAAGEVAEKKPLPQGHSPGT